MKDYKLTRPSHTLEMPSNFLNFFLFFIFSFLQALRHDISAVGSVCSKAYVDQRNFQAVSVVAVDFSVSSCDLLFHSSFFHPLSSSFWPKQKIVTPHNVEIWAFGDT